MTLHTELSAGRWFIFPLSDQLGHVGSEISRTLRAADAGNEQRKQQAFDRALELLDLTIADPKNRMRLRELCRIREVVCDFFYGSNMYHSDGPSLDKYFTQFALMAK